MDTIKKGERKMRRILLATLLTLPLVGLSVFNFPIKVESSSKLSFHIGAFEVCYPCPATDYPEMFENLRNHPDLPTDWQITYERILRLEDVGERFDVVLIWGHRPYTLSDSERAALEKYIENGGLLWIDDCDGLELDNIPFGLEIDFGYPQYRYWGRCYGEYYNILLPNHPLMSGIYTFTEADIRTDPIHEAQWFTPFYSWHPAYEVILWGDDISAYNQDGAAILATTYGKGKIVATAMDITCGLEAISYGNWPAPRFDFRFVYNMLAWSAAPLVITATLDIDPDVLNLKSKGRWITVYIELPKGYDLRDIDRATILLNGSIPVDPFWVDKPLESVIGDHDNDTMPDLMVKFNRAAVSEFILSKGIKYGVVTLTIIGQLYDGTPLEGSNIIRVRMPGDVDCNGKLTSGTLLL